MYLSLRHARLCAVLRGGVMPKLFVLVLLRSGVPNKEVNEETLKEGTDGTKKKVISAYALMLGKK